MAVRPAAGRFFNGVIANMKIHPLLMLLVVIGPSVASAEGLLGGLKEGAAKAATAVGIT